VTQHDDAAALFSDLYRTHYPPILSTCIRRLGSRDAAEDAAHEVFRIAWQHYDPREDNVDLAWLYVTARNVIGNEYRRFARSRVALSRLEPLSADEQSADALDLRAALTRLRASDRELLYMAYWEDLSAQEIGSVLGISAPAVWVRMTRARDALRSVMLEAVPARLGSTDG
jgi:RNA polymerase sigma factor (sigma-70 family)